MRDPHIDYASTGPLSLLRLVGLVVWSGLVGSTQMIAGYSMSVPVTILTGKEPKNIFWGAKAH
jgi:hypothetical protein